MADDNEVEQDGDSRDQQRSTFKIASLKRADSMDIESLTRTNSGSMKWSAIILLAFQSMGIVYGDLGTSPLYVFSSIFPDGVKHADDVLAALSMILYTITLSTLIKYIFIVLQATDNGEGGTFALYSLLSRYAKVGLTPSEQAEDREVSNFELELPTNRAIRASFLKSKLENSKFAKYVLLLATMLGTSMVIGDGVLTPCISVLSAVGGIKVAKPELSQDAIVWISVGILVVLFMVQRFGTDKVGYSFAPIICLWFALNAGIGLHNFIKYDPLVLKALNPKYIVEYFQRHKVEAWISLGGVVLCITGTEALFADVGHFSVRSIRISMCTVTYPALVLAYTGQAAFLRKHDYFVAETFYKSIPKHIYWPMFVVAVLSSIIASQAMISATYSIIQQSHSFGCFPRVKIVHTSAKYEGQVYVPEVNYLLMLACIGITLGFRDTKKIGNAYGIAVVFVMTLTSSFIVLIMMMIWKTHIIYVIAYVLIIGSVELTYLSSVLYKIDEGGYLPLVFSGILMTVMFVWNDVYRRKYNYERINKITPTQIKDIVDDSHMLRLPGVGMFYSELVHGIPPIFKHYMENLPALHSVLIFVSKKSLHISKVPPEERFLFRRIETRSLNVFRCVARYGYTDTQNESELFEQTLVEKLKEYVVNSYIGLPALEDEAMEEERRQRDQAMMEREIEGIDSAWSSGVVHLIGESEVAAIEGAWFGKRILIDYAYNFLKRNLRQSSDKVFDIPHKRMLKVGMTYDL